MKKTGQVADPEVSRLKLSREIAEYREFEGEYRARGWFMLGSEFPMVDVLMASNKTAPPAIVLAVRFDYTNYDLQPPSVRFVNPFTWQSLKLKEMPVRLQRANPSQEIPLPVPIPAMDGKLMLESAQDLLVARTPEDSPILCLPGVREYHDHPAHSGDRWELHKAAGEGRLANLLNTISKYGVEPVNGFNVNLEPKVGFSVTKAPA